MFDQSEKSKSHRKLCHFPPSCLLELRGFGLKKIKEVEQILASLSTPTDEEV